MGSEFTMLIGWDHTLGASVFLAADNKTLLRVIGNISCKNWEHMMDVPISTCHVDPVASCFHQRFEK